MEKNFIEESTYVLFGSEAIQIYNISLDLLISSDDVVYKVAAYNEVSAFVKESEKWDDFLEINEKDYLKIKNYKSNSQTSRVVGKPKRNKKPSFFDFFK